MEPTPTVATASGPEPHRSRCKITELCGRSLPKAVSSIAIITILLSLLAMVVAILKVWMLSEHEVIFNGHPTSAIDLLFALFASSVSLYQIIISILLYTQARFSKGDMFVCWLWFVSHVAVMVLYCLFFTARSIIYFKQKETILGALSVVVGIFYECIFACFTLTVNSFIDTIEGDIYY